MTYVYQAWPAWCHGPKGETAIFESEDDLPKGWTHHRAPRKAKEGPNLSDPHNVPSASEEALKEAAKPVGQAAKDDLAILRAAYKEKYGKKPFGAWNADTLKEKLAEAEDN